jgi:zona occludens toxin
MLHLITGANGAAKTLNALKWVRDRQIKETRPVCHNGRFEPVEGGELSSWKKIDFKDWQAEPDGTIFLIDECHNDMPVRQAGSATPDHIKMLAEHRRRGMDFYLITQHPQNIDSFVRRLIGSPGWHRHLKRTFGADLVRCIEWAAVNPNCEKDGSGKTGTITTIPFPKDVYGWYKSASLHTGKKKIPRQVWVLLGAVAVVIAGGWYGVKKLRETIEDPKAAAAKTAAAGGPQSQQQPMQRAAPMTVDEYLDSRKPRIPDFPHTAPAYDDVTRPSDAPYPAACVEMGKTCKCYTQQATLLQVSGAVCLQIVRQGFFMDWKTASKGEFTPRDRGDYHQARNGPPAAQQDPPRTVPAPMPAARPEPRQPVSQWAQGLAARNAQVRSSLQ